MTLSIRRASPKDAAAIARLMADPAVYPDLLQMPYANEERWQAMLGESLAPGKQDLLLVAEVNGELVGQAGLHPVGAAIRRRHAMHMGISVVSTAQRQGIGTALMTALCDYADNWLACLRIELTVYTDNEIAQRLYRNFGFELEGTFRGYSLRDGAYADVHSMARLHPDPPAIVRT